MENKYVFASILACSLFLFGCLSTERLMVTQTTTASSNEAANAIAGTTPSGSLISESQSKGYWSSTSPIAIIAWKYSDASMQLMIQNKDAQKATLTDLSIDDISVFSTETILNPNDVTTIQITMANSCGPAGEPFELTNVSLIYNQGGLSGFTQKGDKPIIGTCS